MNYQKVQLKVFDSDDSETIVEQYFFVDARNQISLLHPNYSNKLEKFKIIEHIEDQVGMDQKKKDFTLYKRILVHNGDKTQGERLEFRNVL